MSARSSPPPWRSPPLPGRFPFPRGSPGKVYRVPSASPPTGSERSPSPDAIVPGRYTQSRSRSASSRSSTSDSYSDYVPHVAEDSDEDTYSTDPSDVAVRHADAASIVEAENVALAAARQHALNLLDFRTIRSPLEDEEIFGDDTPAEYRDAGTLQRLISSRIPVHLSEKDDPCFLPEDLIWHTLLSLLKSCHYLHTGGSTSQADGAGPHWRPIVHNSINPRSIFYKSIASDTAFLSGRYKTCQLGNLSACVVLPRPIDTRTGITNTTELKAQKAAFGKLCTSCYLVDTAGPPPDTRYEAPEFFAWSSNDLPGCPSDMWSIGAVLVTMMTGRNAWDLILEREFKEMAKSRRCLRSSVVERWQDCPLSQRLMKLNTVMLGKLVLELPSKYSIDLQSFANALLAFDPDDRLTAQEALVMAGHMFNGRRREAGLAPVSED